MLQSICFAETIDWLRLRMVLMSRLGGRMRSIFEGVECHSRHVVHSEIGCTCELTMWVFWMYGLG